MIVAAFISDRRDLYLPECQRTFWNHVPPGIVKYWNTVDDRHHELGMAGAVQKAWKWALDIGADYVVHVEEDFVFDRLIPVGAMRRILELCPHLAQVVLKRQPWSTEEAEAGGQIELGELRGGVFTECSGLGVDLNWVEHSTLFSLNPCLIPRRTFELGWPAGPLGVGNESGMTKKCLDAGMRFAYYGRKKDPPRCTHVGHQRGPGWRL